MVHFRGANGPTFGGQWSWGPMVHIPCPLRQRCACGPIYTGGGGGGLKIMGGQKLKSPH